MPNLIIGNVDNESMVGDPSQLTDEAKCTSSIVANRLTWLIKDGDALLLPYPISDAFLGYVCGMLGVDPRSIHVIVPPGAEQATQILTFGVLSAAEMDARIRAIVKEPGSWTVTPYFFDRAVAWLSGHLGMATDSNLRAFFRQGGAEQFNSKVSFRRIAAGHDIPIAEGFVCSSQAELAASIQELVQVTGAVIVKQDFNAGGDGNIIITTGGADPLIGALERIQINGTDEVHDLAHQLWNRLTWHGNSQLVVEAYYKSATPYYSELEIPVQGRRPYLLNFGEMRMDPVWVGFEIPGQHLTLPQLGEFIADSMKLADVARSMGYAGKINCDAIKTQDGQILFTEVNGRLGGCTHIDVVARSLFGADYGNRYTILTRNQIHTGAFEHLLDLLAQADLLYVPGKERGVIILTEDTRRTGTIEYMVVGRHDQEAAELEKAVLEVCQRSGKL